MPQTTSFQMFPLKTLDQLRDEDVLSIPEGTILTAYRGSVAHNMYVPKNDPKHIDDIDLLGVCIGEPKHYFGLHEWGSRGTKEQMQGQYDCVWYEIRKAFSLWLQGNPNVLGILWLRREHFVDLRPAAKRIIDNRNLFVGKHVYASFAGYASAQLQEMESREPAEVREYLAVTAEMKYRDIHPNRDHDASPKPDHSDGIARDVSLWNDEKLRARLAHFQKKGENIGYMGDKRKQLLVEHGYDSKNSAHCIRLLRMAKEFLETGGMSVYRETDREELLDIKAGRWTLEHIKELAEQLFAEIKTARDASGLPEGPDREGAEALLIDILRAEIGER